jgi:hypothetical protein
MTGNRVPDHATMARFICRHEPTLADLFGEVLELCDGAGLIKPGVVSIDGTRIAGNASPEVNHGFASVVGERKVEGAGVGVDMAEFAAVEHDCGGAPGGGMGCLCQPMWRPRRARMWWTRWGSWLCASRAVGSGVLFVDAHKRLIGVVALDMAAVGPEISAIVDPTR